MVLNGSDCGPRDLKQVQNVKYYNKKQKTNNKLYCQNVADEIQTLLSEMHDHPFIQEVIQTKGKPPSVILYLEDNLRDVEQFCTPTARNPSVLGIDRTFNRGACYATTLVYQHNNLIRKGKNNPIQTIQHLQYTYIGMVYIPHIRGSFPIFKVNLKRILVVLRSPKL